jgi:hypothetical protein
MAGQITPAVIGAEMGWANVSNKVHDQINNDFPNTWTLLVEPQEMALWLNGQSPTTYSEARLINMTTNDMIFAIRSLNGMI